MEGVEIKMAKLEQKLDDTCASVGRIECKLDKFIEVADNRYAYQQDFLFWRNLLISGILLTIFIAVGLGYVEKILK